MATRPWDERQAALVSCSDCGQVFGVKPRRLRAIQSGESTARCERCRRGEVLAVTNVEREFWTSQFSIGEIRQIGEAMFGAQGLEDDSWRRGYQFEPLSVTVEQLSLSASVKPDPAA